MLQVALFNFIDVVVIITVFVGFLLACLYLLQKPYGQPQNILLAVLFTAVALYGVDIVAYWSLGVHRAVVEHAPWLFFTLWVGLLIQGPALYLYSLISFRKDFCWGPRCFWHFVPACLYPIYLYAIYGRHDDAFQMRYIEDWQHLTSDPYFYGFIVCSRLLMWGYSCLCVVQLYRYQKFMGGLSASPKHSDTRWYQVLIYGFFFANSWILLSILLSALTELSWGSWMGNADTYFRCVLMCGLLWQALKRSVRHSLRKEFQLSLDAKEGQKDDPLLQKLKAKMQSDKPHLDPLLTQEKLAAQLEVTPKVLSNLLNQTLGQNFFDFVGRYRVDAAKLLLASCDARNLSVAEIMVASGFNSKSAFNQVFKQHVGMPPSSYRSQVSGK